MVALSHDTRVWSYRPDEMRRSRPVDFRAMRRSSTLSVAVATLSVLVVAQAVVAGAAGKGSRVDVPRFTEEAVAAGIEHVYDGSYEFYVGGGVAAFDCDANGLPDLYFAGGSQPAGLYRNRESEPEER